MITDEYQSVFFDSEIPSSFTREPKQVIRDPAKSLDRIHPSS